MRAVCASTSSSLMVEWTCREASSSACKACDLLFKREDVRRLRRCGRMSISVEKLDFLKVAPVYMRQCGGLHAKELRWKRGEGARIAGIQEPFLQPVQKPANPFCALRGMSCVESSLRLVPCSRLPCAEWVRGRTCSAGKTAASGNRCGLAAWSDGDQQRMVGSLRG